MDPDAQGMPDLEEPIDVVDDAEASDEEEAAIRAEYGLDELDEEELTEELDDGETERPDGDPAPPADEDELQASDDPAQPPAEEEEADKGGDELPPAAEAGAEPAAPAAPAPPPEPWTFTVDGKRVEVAGSMVFEADLPDGQKQKMVLMPLAAVERDLRPNLADRSKMRTTQMELLRQLAAKEAQLESHPRILESERIVGVLDGLLALDDDEKVLETLDRIREDYKQWQREAELRARDAQIEAMRKVAPPPDEVLDQLAAEEREEAMRGALTRNVAQLMKEPELAALAGYIDHDDLIAELEEHAEKVFFVAEVDPNDPEAVRIAQERGIKDGDVVVDLAYIRGRMQREAARAQRLRGSLEQRRRVEEENRRRLGGRRQQQQQKPTNGRTATTPRAEEPTDDYERWKADFLGESDGAVIE